MKLQANVRFSNRLVPLLIGILGVLTVIDSFPGWRLLLAGLGGAWLISYLWARSLSRNMGIQREMRFGWAQVGDKMEERFTITNDGWAPCLWCEVIDHSDLPGYNINRVTGVSSHSNLRWRTKGKCIRRGLFTLGPTSLRMADPLHLYHVEITDPRSINLMVTPPIVPLPVIEVAPGGRSGAGRPRLNAPERTVSAAGVREYLPGDSLRWVHWRTTARRDDFYVRLFESTPSGDWWIILDVDENVQVGEEQDSTAEHGVVLCASLADRGLRMGRSVGMVASGEQLVWLPPMEGDAQRWEILRSLATLTPSQRPLAELLEGIRPTLGRNTSLVIITPNVDGDWLVGLLPLLWSGAVPTVLLQDPQTFGGDSSASGIRNILSRWGIYNYLITPELLNQPEAQPGRKGRWDWRVSPTGRAVLADKPRDMSWRVLT